MLQELSQQLQQTDVLSVDDICAAQFLLLGEGRVTGIRTEQKWIGGSDYSPLEAEFVPPPPEHVPDLMRDLVSYFNGATHGALVQAALVHAQFETIHPFPDGNGRIGRALIHAVLQRRGLTKSPILPVSMVLSTQADQYVHGLSRFRDSDVGVFEWIDIFITAADEAVTQTRRLANELSAVREDWNEWMDTYRKIKGKTRTLRADSLEYRLVSRLADYPLLTAAVAAEAFGASVQAANKALENLTNAHVLRKSSIDKGVSGFSQTTFLISSR